MNDPLHQLQRQPAPGRERIAGAFSRAGETRIAALMPYYTLGYPDRATSLAVVKAIAGHSDLLELGIPFSDPLADGPTIQRSTQIALEQGVTVSDCFAMVWELRQSGIETPALFMGYYNPILAYGEERYVADAVASGVDGFIVPDLPLEEAENLDRLAAEAGLVLVHFLAPTSNAQRIARVAARARGFIYLVSLVGVTGARGKLATGLSDFVQTVRAGADVPLAVGFGISTPDQAAEVGSFADGIIIGSALVDAVDRAEDKPAGAEAFVSAMGRALARP